MIDLNDLNSFQLEAILENVAPVFTGQAGKRLRLLRMEKKLDQAQLAGLLGVGPKTITGAENGARAQRNPISMTKLIAVFGVRGVVFILSGKYESEFAERERLIHREYWKSKHAPKGDRTPFHEREHLTIKISKHDLISEVKLLRDELKQLKGKKASKPGKA